VDRVDASHGPPFELRTYGKRPDGREAVGFAVPICKVRRGEIETLEGFRMASILGIMRQCLEGSDAEKRLAELDPS
jgi:hypothetical protein